MKTRKFTAFVLVLALLAFPVLSLGENAPSSIFDKVLGAGRSVKTTVTFEPGEMLTQDPSLSPIGDLLKALRLETVTQQSDDVALAKMELFLQEKPSMTFTELVERAPFQFHLTSNLFGDKAIAFTMEEYVQMYITQMEGFMAQMELQGADEAVLSFYKAYLNMYGSMLRGEMPKLPEFDEQSLQQDLIMPLMSWFTALASTPEITMGTFESDKHDTAAAQTVYSLSASQISDLLTILTNWASKDVNLDTALSYISSLSPDIGDLSASKADVQIALKSLPAGFLINGAAALPQPITVTTWTDAAGNMVALEFNLRVFGEDKTAPEISVLAGFYTKTEADGVNTQLAFDVVSKQDSFAIDFSTKDVPATVLGTDTVSGSQWHAAIDVNQFAMDAFDLKLDFASQQVASGATVKDSWKLGAEVSNFGQVTGILLDNTMNTAPSGADIKADGKLDIYLTGQNAPLASVMYSTATGEPVEIPAIPADSVRPGKMTAEELEAWSQELSMNMMMQMGTIMQNLPPSVLTMMNGNVTY